MKRTGYKVLVAHQGWKKGDMRVCHVSVAEILAKRGLVELPGSKPEKVDPPATPEAPKKAETKAKK